MKTNSDTKKQKLNITEYCLKKHALKNPDKTALIIVDKIGVDRCFSYREHYRAVCQLAEGLKSLGLPRSSVISIQAEDTYDLLILFLAAMAADLVPILLLCSMIEDEILYILKNSHSRLFVQLTGASPIFIYLDIANISGQKLIRN